MIFIASNDYGPLSELISTAGSLMAAVGALMLGFKRRAKWEPSEEDVDRGPQRVASLVTAVAIAILWSQTRDAAHLPFLVKLAIGLAITTIFFLCIYGFVVSIFTYEKEFSPATDQSVKIKVIGGFKLTKEAKREQRRRKVTIQNLFKGAAYDSDTIWTRGSRSFAKLLFVLCYLGLTISGTVALAAATIILGLSQKS